MGSLGELETDSDHIPLAEGVCEGFSFAPEMRIGVEHPMVS
jgi:hypothetical protein